MKYWVHINNKVLGPYEEAELKNVEGFTLDTLIYPEDAKEGETEWKPANEIIEIEPNTNSDTKAEFTIPETITKVNPEKTIRESVDRLDKTLMGLKTTISKSAEMTSGEQNAIEKKLDTLAKEMAAFRADMKEFLEHSKKMNEALVKKAEEQPQPIIAPEPLSESQKEDTIKLHIPVEKPKEDEEKTEDKIENIIGKTGSREDNEKGEVTVSLDKEDDVKTVESSTETLKQVKEDLKDTIMEAQQYPDVQAEEDSEQQRLKEEEEKEKNDNGELEVVDIKTQQSLVNDENKDKLEEPKETEEKKEEEKPEEENKDNEKPEDEPDDDLKILEKTIEEVKEATAKEKIGEEDVVIEERKEVIESLLTPEKESDDANKNDQDKTLSEMVLEDSTSIISDFIPDQNVEEKSSDELSKEEIQDLAKSIVTKEDVDTDLEKSRIDLVSKGVDLSKVTNHTHDPAKNRKKPKDIKTIPGDEESEKTPEKSKEQSYDMDTLEDAEDKKETDKSDEKVVEAVEDEPKSEVLEHGKDDGVLVKAKSKYLLIIVIILLLIVAGYFMGFGKFLKNSYGAKKQGQIIETTMPVVASEDAMFGGLETEGADTTMLDDGFITSDDLVFPGEERMMDEGQPITEATPITPTAETTVEYEVKNHKFPTGLNLEETIINKHMKNKDKIVWQVQESVEENVYSVFVRVPPDNVNQTFATIYSLNYDAGTKVLTATNSEAKNLIEPAPITTP